MKKKKKKIESPAVIYARFSSHNQSELSIDQQIDACKKLIEGTDVEIIEIYEDRAMSGKTDKRPAFQKMMADAKAKKFKTVLAWKSSRIGRNMLEAMTNENILEDCGVRICYAEEDFEDNAAGRFAMRSMMNVNQFYSEAMAEDIKRGMRSAANDCKVTGRIPLGFKKSDDGHIVIDETTAPIIREIFERVANGDSYAEIQDDLNDRGIKTALGKPFTNNSFSKILTNDKYIGVYRYDDIVIEDGLPHIIDDNLWYKVQSQITTYKVARRRHQGGANYLLTGKLFCGECGEAMVGQSGTSHTGTKKYYYRCRNALKHTCKKKSQERTEIENFVAEAICKEILTDESIDVIAGLLYEYNKKKSESPELINLKAQYEHLEKVVHNLLIAMTISPESQAIHDELKAQEEERVRVGKLIDSLTARITPLSKEQFVKILQSVRTKATSQERNKKRIFDIFLTAVYLYDDGSVKIVCDAGVGDGIKEVEFAQTLQKSTNGGVCEHIEVKYGYICCIFPDIKRISSSSY